MGLVFRQPNATRYAIDMSLYHLYNYLESEIKEGRLTNNILVEHLQNLVGSANFEICRQVAHAADVPLEQIFPKKVVGTKPVPGSTRNYSTFHRQI